MRVYELTAETRTDVRFLYNMKCPPNSSVSETWTTWGIEIDGASLSFVEYVFYDKDPDGVREAYGCTYDSEHTITVEADHADPEKLFAYTVYPSGKMEQGFGIDTKQARAIYVFTQPMPLSAVDFKQITDGAEAAHASGEDVESYLRHALLGDDEEAVCLAYVRAIV